MKERDTIKKIFCPFCNAPYTGEMLHELFICDEAYTPGINYPKAVNRIEIRCRGCKKIVYVKEFEERFDENDIGCFIDNLSENK